MHSDLFSAIFVHIPKTAGQSVEQVFLDKHGLDWRSRAPLLMRERDADESGPTRLAHLFAREYVECGYLSRETFVRCFKFATVRHPYDRAFSEFRYRSRRRELDERRFVRLLSRPDPQRHLVPQWEFVVGETGNVIVDTIIRFESLQTGFDEVAKRIFGKSVPLPHVNRSPGFVQCDFGAELKNAVYKRYERDFDLFRYPKGT